MKPAATAPAAMSKAAMSIPMITYNTMRLREYGRLPSLTSFSVPVWIVFVV
jgi:hypothetical protein